MLSRRVFRQLTDSLLLGPNYRPAVTLCFASRCTTCSSRSRAVAPVRHASSSSTRWKSRQGKDFFAKEARVQGLKSRAAFKLLEVLALRSESGQLLIHHSSMKSTSCSSLARRLSIWYAFLRCEKDDAEHIQGFAPGSWSQVSLPLQVPFNILIRSGRCKSDNSKRSRGRHRSYTRTTSTRSVYNPRQLPVA
jgi:hypothetical protein